MSQDQELDAVWDDLTELLLEEQEQNQHVHLEEEEEDLSDEFLTSLLNEIRDEEEANNAEVLSSAVSKSDSGKFCCFSYCSFF